MSKEEFKAMLREYLTLEVDTEWTHDFQFIEKITIRFDDEIIVEEWI